MNPATAFAEWKHRLPDRLKNSLTDKARVT